MIQDHSRARGAPSVLEFLVLTPLVALASTACSDAPQAIEASTAHQAKQREPTLVLVAAVEQRETVRRLETTTRVESEHEVEIYPRAAGVVMGLYVEEGDPVKQGQVLALLDDREALIAKADAENTLQEARDNLPKLALAVREAEARNRTAQSSTDQAERDHARNVAIAEGVDGQPGLISRRELDASMLACDQARGELEATDLAEQRASVEEQAGQGAVGRAQLALDRAELTLSYTRITAPFDGVIAERATHVGSTMTTTAAAFVLSDRHNLRTVFHRPQRELNLFRHATVSEPEDDAPSREAGTHELLQIDATAEALPGEVFKGWIERVAPTIDPASGNFRVTARLEIGEPPMNLLPGMLVRLRIVTERHPNALVVPKRAIRREGDRNLIFVVRDGSAFEVIVDEGFPDGDDIEVLALSGELAEGELVVVVGNRDLEDGAEVRISDPEAESDDAQPAEPQPGADASADSLASEEG